MKWWWWWWGCVVLMVPLGDTSSIPKVALNSRFHDLHELRGNIERHDHTPARPPPPRPFQSSVLNSLLELGLQDDNTSLTDDLRTSPDDSDVLHHPDNDPFITLEESDDLLTKMKPILHDLLAPSATPLAGSNDWPPLQQHLAGLRTDAWGHLKGVMQSYLGLLEGEYEAQHLKERLPLALIRRALEVGDQVNLLRTFGEKLDPGLKEQLEGAFRPLLHYLSEAGRAAGDLSSTLGGLVNHAARHAVHGLVDYVLWVTKNHVTGEELRQYRDNLEARLPLAALGLNLLLENSRARSLGSFGGYGEYDMYGSGSGVSYGGYGAYDRYGVPTYGHKYGIYLDPYLVLAGLGAAALLAYLAYKVILSTATMTAAASTARSAQDDALANTDIPEVVHALHSSLDDARLKYESDRSLSRSWSLREEEDGLDDLAEALNMLWRGRHDDPACLSCHLAHHSAARPPHLTPLLLSLVGHLLGIRGSGQLLDQVTGQVLEGRPVTCPGESNSCSFK